MPSQRIAILNAGLVTSVGLSAPAACAAIRAAISNHTETRFIDSNGKWILGAGVSVEPSCRGRAKLVTMLSMAINECLEPFAALEWEHVPLLLCIAERDRPGREMGLDDKLFSETEAALQLVFDRDHSATIARGRVSALLALDRARKLLEGSTISHVLIAATDSLLVGPTVVNYESRGRLLTAQNSNGFIPGEAAGAILVGRDANRDSYLMCEGIGFGREAVTVESEEPFRADGLTTAIRIALGEADRQIHDVDFRITDLSGEQYYFKEASLALGRILRHHKEEFDIWHPADCIGEVGAAAGTAAFAVALTAFQKGYALGPSILVHSSNDGGDRAATVLKCVGAS